MAFSIAWAYIVDPETKVLARFYRTPPLTAAAAKPALPSPPMPCQAQQRKSYTAKGNANLCFIRFDHSHMICDTDVAVASSSETEK